MITTGTNMKKILLTLTCALFLTGCLAQEPVEQQDNKPSETETPENNNNDNQNTNENPQIAMTVVKIAVKMSKLMILVKTSLQSKMIQLKILEPKPLLS